jgi:RimJ/RimL family protein N-acetyltransferase
MELIEIGPELAGASEAEALAPLAGWPAPAPAVRLVVIDIVHALARMVQDNGAPPPWRGYLAATEAAGAIGTCAFKAAPADGAVEIAYYTFAPFERRGHGKAMVRRLVEIAAASGAVERVVAHTNAAANPSVAILRGLGFAARGEVDDPSDGRVWRWEKTLQRT